MFKSRSKKKVIHFIKTLEECIEVFNKHIIEQEAEYEIQSLIKKVKTSNKNILKHMMEFKINMVREDRVFIYELNKCIELPSHVEVENMEIISLNIDSNELEKSLDKLDEFQIVKNQCSIIDFKTIQVKNDNTTVLGGYETDFIYPEVKQNNPDSKIDDDELNELIKKHNNFEKIKMNTVDINNGLNIDTIL